MKKNTYPTMLWFILMLNVPAISYACYYVKQCLLAACTNCPDESDDDVMKDDPNFYQHGRSAYDSMRASEKARPSTTSSATRGSTKKPQQPSAPQATAGEATALLAEKSEKK